MESALLKLIKYKNFNRGFRGFSWIFVVEKMPIEEIILLRFFVAEEKENHREKIKERQKGQRQK